MKIKRYILLLSLLCAVSCVKDPLPDDSGRMPQHFEEGLEGTVTLRLGSNDFEHRVSALTRSSGQNEDDEQHIHSIYLFIVKMADENDPAACPVIARKFFPDVTALQSSVTVDGKTLTTYDLSMKALSCANASIFAIANLGYSDMQHISNDKELLAACDEVTNLSHLHDLSAGIEVADGIVNVERTQGHHLMTGFYTVCTPTTYMNRLDAGGQRINLIKDPTLGSSRLDLYDVTSTKPFVPLGSAASDATLQGAILLHRLDAKITFNVSPAGSLTSTPGAYYRLTSWQVVNAPTAERLRWHDAGEDHTHTEHLGNSRVFTRDISQKEDKTWTFTYYQFENCNTNPVARGTTTGGYVKVDGGVIADEWNRQYALTGEGAINAATVSAAFEPLPGMATPNYPNTYTDFAYTLREQQIKGGYTEGADDQTVTVTNGDYEFAPKNGTYIVLKGTYYNPAEPVRRRADDERNNNSPEMSLADYPYWSEDYVPVRSAAEAMTRTRTANTTHVVHLGFVGGNNFDVSSAETDKTIRTLTDYEKKVNDYNVFRNHHYTYNISIAGVNNIKVEATREDGGNIYEQEEQTGAEGFVVESQHLFSLDAHYETRNLSLDFAKMPLDVEEFGFRLITPYERIAAGLKLKTDGSYGIFDRNTDTEITTIEGHDLNWIHFAWHGTPDNPSRSLIDPATGNGISYSQTYGGYVTQNAYNDPQGLLTKAQDANHPYYLMNSNEFIMLVWEHYRQWLADGKPDARRTMHFTVYVDEFYYDNNPITGGNVDWMSFTNVSARTAMYFMDKGNISADGQSTFIDTHIAISQNSIQTPFATSTAGGQSIADVAFGIERLDEFKGKYNPSESYTDQYFHTTGTALNNGLYNTMLWYNNGTNVIPWAQGESYYHDKARAYTPLQTDYTQPDISNPLGRTDRRGAWAVYSRNRDLNRDGELNPNEIRWFVPAINQYQVCFLGGRPVFDQPLFIRSEAIVVNGSMGIINPYMRDVPIMHFMANSEPNTSVFWAEEGATMGRYGAPSAKTRGCYGIRMARMLCRHGIDDTGSAFTATGNPDQLVQDKIFFVSETPNGAAITDYSQLADGRNYYITLHKLNTLAFREYVASGDLAQHLHTAKNNWLYRQYKVAKNKVGYTSYTDATTYDRTPRINGVPLTWWRMNGVKNTAGTASGNYYYDGPTSSLAYSYTESDTGEDLHRWRVPNLREATIMSMVFPSAWFGGNMSARSRSDNLGPGSTNVPYWVISNNSIVRNPSDVVRVQYVRPVHDVR